MVILRPPIPSRVAVSEVSWQWSRWAVLVAQTGSTLYNAGHFSQASQARPGVNYVRLSGTGALSGGQIAAHEDVPSLLQQSCSPPPQICHHVGLQHLLVNRAVFAWLPM
jgi:hypothetical protein